MVVGMAPAGAAAGGAAAAGGSAAGGGGAAAVLTAPAETLNHRETPIYNNDHFLAYITK